VLDRRTFLAGTGAGLLAAPLAVEAQQVHRIGVLLFSTPTTDPQIEAFRRGLRELGYVEGRNVTFDYGFADGHPERLPQLAVELVSRRPDLIFALGGDVAPYAKRATTSIPIVVAVSVDPVMSGLVGGLARPGGNVTGVTFVQSELAGKRIQLLKEASPAVSRVGVIWNPQHPDGELESTWNAARSLGVEVKSLEVRGPADFDKAFETVARERVQAVIVVSSRLMSLNRQRILDFAAKNRLVLVSGWGAWAAEGALLSYGPELDVVVRRAASYVDKILKGAKPADLPIEQPTKFDLVINLKTAKALGLKIPPSLLGRADQVIE
jgi:putative ABC transport system substrate-binding protein